MKLTELAKSSTQTKALDYLQSQLTDQQLSKFTELWQAKPAQSDLKLDTSFASRIIRYMQSKSYKIFTAPGEKNIVYVEGCSADGTVNNDSFNMWNDRSLIIEFFNGTPRIIHNFTATTEPGDYYTHRPMNPSGCARICFGQWKAWSVGYHRSPDHEALVQTGSVSVTRDLNKDYVRTGDKVDTGLFGINQHHGYDAPLIGRNSAGCLVRQSVLAQREFMRSVKSDPRYLADSSYVFWSTVLPGNEIS